MEQRCILIAGTSRSGSTLLGMLLGSQPEALFVGESRGWSVNWQRNWLCGCGTPFRECGFWSDVLELAAADLDALTPEDPGYIDAVICIQQAARRVSGADVIVDSSKKPTYFERLGRHPAVTPITVHIIRDPRGVVTSAHRGWKKKRDPLTRPPLTLTIRVTVHWERTNFACQRLLRRVNERTATIRYEDLVADPEAVTRRLANLAGIDIVEPVTRIGRQHVPSGNPLRYSSGDLPVTLDDAWHRVLSTSHQRLAFLLGLPLTARYGYRPAK